MTDQTIPDWTRLDWTTSDRMFAKDVREDYLIDLLYLFHNSDMSSLI
jgi:hypothetical protein